MREKIDAKKHGDKDRVDAVAFMEKVWEDLREHFNKARRFGDMGAMPQEAEALDGVMKALSKLCVDVYVLPDGTEFTRSGKFSKQLNDLLDGENNPC